MKMKQGLLVAPQHQMRPVKPKSDVFLYFIFKCQKKVKLYIIYSGLAASTKHDEWPYKLFTTCSIHEASFSMLIVSASYCPIPYKIQLLSHQFSFSSCFPLNPFHDIPFTPLLHVLTRETTEKQDPPFSLSRLCVKSGKFVWKKGDTTLIPIFHTEDTREGPWQRGNSPQRIFPNKTECRHTTLFLLSGAVIVSFTGKVGNLCSLYTFLPQKKPLYGILTKIPPFWPRIREQFCCD